jgi:hypothetical protein
MTRSPWPVFERRLQPVIASLLAKPVEPRIPTLAADAEAAADLREGVFAGAQRGDELFASFHR